MIKPARIDEQSSCSLIGKLIRDRVVLRMHARRQNVFEQLLQPGTIEPAAADRKHKLSLNHRRRQLKGLVKSAVCGLHAQVPVKNQEGLPYGLHDVGGVFPRRFELQLAAFNRIDIEQRHGGPDDLVVRGLVRPNHHPIPSAFLVRHLALLDGLGIEHFPNHRLEIGQVDLRLEIAHRPPDVAGHQVQYPLALGLNRRTCRSIPTTTVGMSRLSIRLARSSPSWVAT